MPHDYKRRPLAVGNLVLMLAVLTAVNEGDACNFTATIVDPKAPLPYPPAPPSDLENQTYLPTVTANGKLLDLVDAIDLEQAASFAYDEYRAAGGKSDGGNALPDWAGLIAQANDESEENKEIAAKSKAGLEGWRAVGRLVELSCKKQIHLSDVLPPAPSPKDTPPEEVPADIAETKGWRKRIDEMLSVIVAGEVMNRDLDQSDRDRVQKLIEEIEGSPNRQSEERDVAVRRLNSTLFAREVGADSPALLLKEAIMWLGMDLKAINEERPGAAPTPYPSSYDPKSAKIEPTSEGLRLGSPTGEGQGFTSKANAASLAAFNRTETIKLGASAGAFLPVQPVTTSTGVVQDPSGRTQSADVASVPATPAPAAAEQKEGN